MEAIAVTMPYTIAVYMVRSWVVEPLEDTAKAEARVSQLTGVLVRHPAHVYSICPTSTYN